MIGDLIAEDNRNSVVRWPDQPNDPMITVDIGLLWSLQKIVNKFGLPDNKSELGTPEERVQSKVNLLWDKFRDGLERQGLWHGEDEAMTN